MNRFLLYCLSVLLFNFSHSQELLNPLSSNSFGLNHHTNRDAAIFSHVDNNGNSFIVGTTEKDTTFTDIITIKVNNNLDEVWKKIFSVPTNLSYDLPVKSFLSVNNEVYIVGRSSLNHSNHNGLVFIVKYDEVGNLIYNKVFGSIDGSDYVDYAYLDAQLNEDDSIDIVYAITDTQSFSTKQFNFIKIDSDGNIIKSFSRNISYQDIVGKISYGKYYFLTKERIDDINITYKYNLYIIHDENQQFVYEISDNNFASYYRNTVISEQVKLTIDDQFNCFLTGHNLNDNDKKNKIHLAKIDSGGLLKYALTTAETDNYFLIDSYINTENKNIVIANNLNSNSIEFLTINGNTDLELLGSRNDFLATGFKKNSDHSFYLTSSNSNINLFSSDFNLMSSFQTSDSFSLSDFSKIDNTHISVIGTRFDKMFQESDFYTQLDIVAEKIDNIQITNDYEFSGIGTSKAFQQNLIIDNDNNYIVLVTEKMGPEYAGIGGVSPPLNNRIIKYNSNLEVIWEVNMPEDIFNIVNFSRRDTPYYLDANNDLYLSLPKEGNYYGIGYYLYKISPSGDVEYLNNSYLPSKFFGTGEFFYISHNRFSSADETTVYKLDKVTGNLLNEMNIGSEIVLDFFSIGADDYFYTYDEFTNNTPDVIYLYKNDIKIYTRNLSENYGIWPYEIDQEGTLFFATDYSADRRINKLDIYNSYSFYNIPDNIQRIKRFNNGNIYLYLDNYDSMILDKDLNFITNGESLNSSYPYLMALGNYIILGTNYDNSIRVIDQDGQVLKYFKTEGYLHPWYSKFDNNDNLIMVGLIENKIYTYNEYSWARGFIHNYGVLDIVLSTEDVGYNKEQESIIIYPNPSNDVYHLNNDNKTINKVQVYDTSGKLLKTINNQHVIDIKELSTGIYYLKIFSGNSVYTNKVIKN